MLILIPAYEPDLKLIELLGALSEQAPTASIVVVDDGSGPRFDGIFDVARLAGASVVRFETNRGKGAALKSGFAWAMENRPGETIVCADCDGQHSPTDILKVGNAVEEGTMVLGGRRFTGRVPMRSRVGNAVSRHAFRLVTGVSLHDTQTGLRAYPADLIPWLMRVPGDRFEYEANALFEARAAGVRIAELPIETIYLDANASSHFRPVRDSARIFAPLLGFVGASLISSGVDWVGVLVLHALTGNLLVAVAMARLGSATVNYRLNRDVVFADAGDSRSSLRRYAALAACVLAANYLLLAVLVQGLGVPLVPAKLAVEIALFVAGYVVQRRAVFRTPLSTVGPPSKAAEPVPASVRGQGVLQPR